MRLSKASRKFFTLDGASNNKKINNALKRTVKRIRTPLRLRKSERRSRWRPYKVKIINTFITIFLIAYSEP